MSLIELDQLVKSYGMVQALTDLTLDVPEGCLYGLLGPNGAGKTTTLRILATLLAPDAGQVIVAGVDALRNPRQVRQILGYVAQEVALTKFSRVANFWRCRGTCITCPERRGTSGSMI